MQVNFTWNANTESDLAGYFLYAGTVTQNYNDPNSPKDMGLVTAGFYVLDDFADPATYFFSLTAYNTLNVQSTFSDEVSAAFALGLSPNRSIGVAGLAGAEACF